MKKIKYIGPDKYFNMKADLIVKNKIDCVHFDVNYVIKQREEILSKEIILYEFENDSPKFDNNKIQFAKGIQQFNDFDDEATYWNLCEIEAFKDKHFYCLDRTTFYAALLIESKNNITYDSLIDNILIEYHSVNIDEEDKKISTNETIQKISKSIYDERIINTLNGMSPNTSKIKLINEKQAFVYYKVSLTGQQTRIDYTKSLNISITADTWNTNKRGMYYILDHENEVTELLQKPDGNFDRITPKNIFNYPSSELTQYEIFDSAGNVLIKQIAKEILLNYKFGRRTIEFELPLTTLKYVDYKGEKVETFDSSVLDIKLGESVIIGDEYGQFVGGIYKVNEMYNIRAEVKRTIEVPKQYEVTNIEYKYDGGLTIAIKAIENPFSESVDFALTNGKFNITLM